MPQARPTGCIVPTYFDAWDLSDVANGRRRTSRRRWNHALEEGIRDLGRVPTGLPHPFAHARSDLPCADLDLGLGPQCDHPLGCVQGVSEAGIRVIEHVPGRHGVSPHCVVLCVKLLIDH